MYIVNGKEVKNQKEYLLHIEEANKELENIGGMTYLTELAGSEATTAHAAEYARLVAGKATLRRLDVAGHAISGLAHDETRELEGLLDEAEQALFSVSQKHLKQNFICPPPFFSKLNLWVSDWFFGFE